MELTYISLYNKKIMKKHLENLNLQEISSDEMITINGGGILRKYGEYLGEKVGSIAIYVTIAYLTGKFF